MIPKQRIIATALTLAACATLPKLSAQDEEEDFLLPGDGVPLAFAAMKESKWAEAQRVLDIVFKSSPEGSEEFGGKWGSLYYNKGYCERNLGKEAEAAGDAAKAAEFYAKAIESFQTCYSLPTDDISSNPYEKKCLLYLGQVKQFSGDYAGAIESYKKFVAELDKERSQDKFDAGEYYVNLTISHLRLDEPEIEKGTEFFQNALSYRTQGNVPDKAVVSCFQALAEACIKVKNESALLDFLRDNRGALTLDPFMMYQFTPFFQNLASQAKKNDMVQAMLAIYTLIPGSQITQDDIQARQSLLKDYPAEGIKDGQNVIAKKQLEVDLGRVRKKLSSGTPHEVYGLLTMASIHEQAGNVRGAFNVYEQLEQYYNKSQFREASLFNLVRTSSILGDVAVTERYGRLFSDTFPQSEQLPEVQKMMLTALFFEGKYEDCEVIASSVLSSAKKPSEYHDMALHVLGGSKFYLAKFKEAKPLLEEHVETYPDSLFKVSARYMEASCLGRLYLLSASASKLDSFTKDYPNDSDNPFLANALYDRASIHVTEENYEPALALIERIETEFSSSSMAELAMNLRGNIQLTQQKEAEAEESFKQALARATERGNDSVAAEALFYLVSIIGPEKVGKEENPRLTEAVPYYDQFWKNHQNSGYKTQLAVVGIPALTKVGRSGEALENLQSVISEMAQQKNAPGLERAINSYTKYYLQSGKSVEELQRHYQDFPNIDRDDRRTKALLRIAVIGAFESALAVAEEAKVPADVNRYSAAIEVSFQKLRKEFEPAELSNFILLRMGEYIRTSTSNPEFAEAYYEQILENTDRFGREAAQFGLADIWGQSSDGTKVAKAVTILKEVYATQLEDQSLCEQALYRLVEIAVGKEDWAEVQELSRQYLKPANRSNEAHKKMSFSKNKPKMSFLFATSFDKQGQVEDAIANYKQIFGAYPNKFSISAPSCLRGMELTWKRNRPAPKLGAPSDKQAAYEWGAYFIKWTKDTVDQNKQKIPDDVLAHWEAVRALSEQYEKDPNVVDLATVEQRKREGKPLYAAQ